MGRPQWHSAPMSPRSGNAPETRPDSRPLAVFDVDGVLADVRHRLHHVERSGRHSPDWEAFFAAAPLDPPLAQGLALVHQAERDCEVAYLTGRPERCRADTLAWFAAHDLPAGTLVMRPDDDRSPARLAKPRWLTRLTRGRVLAVVVDDDPAVCEAYRARGWTVIEATWMTQDPDVTEQLTLLQEDQGRT